ncbi:MAG: orotate phosphoribosyltransferase [candidate division WOR-3 bacterium]|nr:orotate phosphoribosyltransferase [candidate division WOR-3 bacterium]MCX7947365.1 orotate phosphoribosyltransferase [candidate division WOR-3 bacterium]MDW8150079.1 orotate phosphoribosyltransferase [candidate division WOR-3 bacterium]
MKDEVLEIYEKTGAIKKGHFLLSSGLHSDIYFQSALVLQYPNYAEFLCKKLANFFKDYKVSVVVGPALGAILVAYETARFLNARAVFTEREVGIMKLRRGFAIEKGENVLIVEDVITTGLSTKEVIEVVRSYDGNIVGIGCLVDRSENLSFDYPLYSLLKINVKTYNPYNCELCKQNIPIEKPGSR